MVGCRLNQAEIERLAQKFRSKGYDITPEPRQADLIIINTCCVTHKAAADSRKMIRHFQSLTSARVIATGCWATLFRKEALHDLDKANFVTNSQKDGIPDLFENLDVVPVEISEKPNLGPRARTRAFVKVQDGCDNKCAYCATQLARGKSRSITTENVITELKQLESDNVKEIVLSGVQLGSWGRDLGLELADLITSILEQTSIPRIRLSSIEPWELNQRLISLWSDKRMMPHLHIPLQSGSSPILLAMHRLNTSEDYRGLLALIRSEVPEMAISTDVIVGFPGEDLEKFSESLSFVESCNFSRGHVFQFSPMEFTEAATLARQVSTQEKKSRSNLMMKCLHKAQAAYNQLQLGRTIDVLFEANKGAYATGLTPDFQRVKLRTDLDLHNTIQAVRLVELENAETFISEFSNQS